MTMSLLRAGVVAALVIVGNFFLLVGTVGLLRLPDVYNRMHATSKATTLGASSILLAGFVFFLPEGAALTSLVGIVFLFLTAPTGAHLISRSAQKMGVPLALEASWPQDAPEVGETSMEHESRGADDGSAGADDGSAGVDDGSTDRDGESAEWDDVSSVERDDDSSVERDDDSSTEEAEPADVGEESSMADEESAETDEE